MAPGRGFRVAPAREENMLAGTTPKPPAASRRLSEVERGDIPLFANAEKRNVPSPNLARRTKRPSREDHSAVTWWRVATTEAPTRAPNGAQSVHAPCNHGKMGTFRFSRSAFRHSRKAECPHFPMIAQAPAVERRFRSGLDEHIFFASRGQTGTAARHPLAESVAQTVKSSRASETISAASGARSRRPTACSRGLSPSHPPRRAPGRGSRSGS